MGLNCSRWAAAEFTVACTGPFAGQARSHKFTARLKGSVVLVGAGLSRERAESDDGNVSIEILTLKRLADMGSLSRLLQIQQPGLVTRN